MYPVRGPGESSTAHSKLPAWHYWIYWAGVCCAIAAALSAFGIIGWRGRSLGKAYDRFAAAYHAQFSANRSSDLDIPQQRLFPYSVIPGGVENAQELRNAIANDPLVAALYANFNLARAHIIRLTHDRWVYVSYRLNGHIYWTKKRILLRAGETLITDGTHDARTRCGNRISETPVQPVSGQEPPSSAINAPPSNTLVAENPGPPPTLPLDPTYVGPPSLAPPLPSIPPPDQPPSGPPVYFIPPPIFPIVGGGPPPLLFPPPPPPPVATPEPGTIWLLILGLLAIGAAAGLRPRRQN